MVDPPLRFSGDFESGSLGAVRRKENAQQSYELALRDDNDDARLPASFRTWWYARVEGVDITIPLQLEFTRLGFTHFFIPVYSYDQQHWHHFDESDVQQSDGCRRGVLAECTLTVTRRFDHSKVWLARTFPYPHSQLEAYLQTHALSPYLRVETLGQSPRLGQSIRLLRIGADETATASPGKRAIWIHARSHGAETGPSYLLEGLIDSLLADSAMARDLRRSYVFYIVPMHNIDGVMLGNYRTNANSINLENQWLFDRNAPLPPPLLESAPAENRLLHRNAMQPSLLDSRIPVEMALNLHSSNSAPDVAAFLFPHFGDDPTRYGEAERRLFNRQLQFIHTLAGFYGGRIERPPAEGGRGFLQSFFPETWWWHAAGDQVNAITLETVYGRAGFDHWVTQEDLRELGRALAHALHALRPAGGPASGTPMPAASPYAAPVAAGGRPDVFRLPFKPWLYEKEPER